MDMQILQVRVNGRMHSVYGPDWCRCTIDNKLLMEAVDFLKEFIGVNVTIHYDPVLEINGAEWETVYLRGDDCTGPSVMFKNGMFWLRTTEWVDDDAYLYED